jgi:hypothetical protein
VTFSNESDGEEEEEEEDDQAKCIIWKNNTL